MPRSARAWLFALGAALLTGCTSSGGGTRVTFPVDPTFPSQQADWVARQQG